MDLTPDPLRERLRRSVRDALATPGIDTDEAVSALLHALSAALMELPVAAGGFDLGLTAGVVFEAELGRRALPDRYLGLGLVADALGVQADPDGPAGHVAAGRDPVVVGALQPYAAARAVPAGWLLSGRAPLPGPVAGAYACVPVRSGTETLLALLAPGLVADRTAAAPGGGYGLTLDGLTVPGSAMIASLGEGSPLSDPDGLLLRLRVRQAAYLAGLAAGAHALAVRHAGGRRQFGRPILDNQGVSFPLAQIAITNQAALLMVERAAWLADTGQADPLAAVHALGLAVDAALTAATAALQVHGAIGLVTSRAPHRYYTTVRTAAVLLGPPAELWR
ncbi:acyl-CoA dehydrogenase family protein, partial [Acrocarpospora phusangensis]|uniref:acyl-CoA dehydrogenase family protein n=1 Tax=Acrocarpospora phusangensis TaxID=1070424 RepID=UPI00194FBAAE